jgi:ketosteroid isomerase-like protein
MTIIRTCSAAALFCAIASHAAAQSAVDQVKALEKQRFEVMVKGDYDALDKLLADDLIYVHSNGNRDDEKAFLGNLRAGKSKYNSIEPMEMNARQVGEFVFIDGRGHFQTEGNGQKNDMVLTYLDVWAKRNGTWQMIQWHSARMPAPAAAPATPAPKP